ncbi:hypothetical protein DFH06DRAFT_1226554 [Mycena polygramma]|nr:hypothetical protein DFH06DRAFT_1226554 [Mycena polygramma]
MRLMYHEQVRSFVRNNRDILLSRATMEICFSYPPFKHVSPATKLLILKELNGRVESVGDAAIVAQSFDSAWDVVTQLLHSADARMRQYTCQLLGTLAPSYDSTSSRLEACVQLASRLRDDATVVQSAAFYAISQSSEGRDGVQAVADIEIWEYIPEYLDSWNSHNQRSKRHCDRSLSTGSIHVVEDKSLSGRRTTHSPRNRIRGPRLPCELVRR